MAKPLDPKDLVTLEELAISTMWESAALVELLECKGVVTRQELYQPIKELRQRHPPEATTLERPWPSSRCACRRLRRPPQNP